MNDFMNSALAAARAAGVPWEQRTFRFAGGRRRSVSLKPVEWRMLEDLVVASVDELRNAIVEIDTSEGEGSLESKIRIWMLRRVRENAAANTGG